MKTFMKRVRDFILADMTDKLVREHQKDRDLAYFVSLPDHTLRITHRGRVFTFFIPDADRDTVQRHILETRAFYELDILTRLRDQVSVKGRVVADMALTSEITPCILLGSPERASATHLNPIPMPGRSWLETSATTTWNRV